MPWIPGSLRSKAVYLGMAAAMTVGQNAPAQQMPTPAPNNAPQVTTVKTFATSDFQLSRIDRLSGGLRQQIPFRMVTDSQGRILVTDPFLSLVHVFDVKAGKWWQLTGDRALRMKFPTYIAVDADDNIYVSEPLRGKVDVFLPDGHYLRTIGDEHLYVPFGLAIDKAAKKLYVADHYWHAVLVYSLDGAYLHTIGSRGTDLGQLLDPCDIALHHGLLFVLDRGNSRFQFFDLEGNSKGVWPFGDNRRPSSFALDRAGNLYAVDMLSLGMLVFDPAGNPVANFDVLRQYAQPSAAPQFPSVTSVAANPDGSMLALRPALAIDVFKLQPDTLAAPGKSPELH